MPCLVVESSRGKKRERSVREKDLKRFTAKESLKGSRKESLLERARRRSKYWIPYLRQRGINSSSQKNTRISRWFPLEGNLCHFDKAAEHHAARDLPRATGDQESKIRQALLAGTSVVLVNAV